jgi:hypothetical protein
MGLILDSSVLITAERKGQSVKELIAQVIAAAGNQDAAMASVALVELTHGVPRRHA